MRKAATVIAVLAILTGLVWMGQGSGYFPYPASSFMIDQSPWITNGAILAIAGLVLLWVSRRYLR
ncbi:hypothetical protein [Rhizobium sp. PAMB 3182]